MFMYIIMPSVELEPHASLNETTISMFTDDEATDDSSSEEDFRYLLV